MQFHEQDLIVCNKVVSVIAMVLDWFLGVTLITAVGHLFDYNIAESFRISFSAQSKLHFDLWLFVCVVLVHHKPCLACHPKPATCGIEQIGRVALGVVTARICYVPSGSLTPHRINNEELCDGAYG